jgi:hypothetical protein
MQNNHNKLTPAFNQLSLIDRFTLRSAVMATSITRIAREDTLRNRALFIPYAVPIGIAMIPLPMIPGSNIVPLGVAALGIGGWAWLGLTESARRNKEELKRDFSHAAMIENYKAMIAPDTKAPGKFNVKNGKIAWHVTKEMGRDSWTATRHFFGFPPK